MSEKVVIPLKVGDSTTFTKTISESDVYGFGGIIGDYNPIHFNAEHAKKTPFKERLVHGALTFAFTSTVSTVMQDRFVLTNPSLSYGYDQVRFINPVKFGDTITAVYTVMEIDEKNAKTFSKVEVFNQDGVIVCACKHILKFYAKED